MNSDECLDEIFKIFQPKGTNITPPIERLSSLGCTLKHNKLLFFDFRFSEIIPIRREKGAINLKVPIVPDEYREIVSFGYIHRAGAHNYFSSLLNRTFNMNEYACYLTYNNGHLSYKKTYHYYCSPDNAQTSIDVEPAFKLPFSQWPFADPLVPLKVRNDFPWFYAVPWKNPINNDDRTFSVCAPEWEDVLLMEHPKSTKILRLMEELRKKHADSLPQLTDYMLRTVVLHQLPIVNWQRDWVSLLSEMWTRLVDNLRAGRIDSFLVDELNLLDCMEPTELEQCEAFARELLFKILEARYNGSRDDLEKLFGIKLK